MTLPSSALSSVESSRSASPSTTEVGTATSSPFLSSLTTTAPLHVSSILLLVAAFFAGVGTNAILGQWIQARSRNINNRNDPNEPRQKQRRGGPGIKSFVSYCLDAASDASTDHSHHDANNDSTRGQPLQRHDKHDRFSFYQRTTTKASEMVREIQSCFIGELPKRTRRAVWPWQQRRRRRPSSTTSSSLDRDGGAASPVPLTRDPASTTGTLDTGSNVHGVSSVPNETTGDPMYRRSSDHDLCIGSIFGMDVGGTLAKLVYFEESPEMDGVGHATDMSYGARRSSSSILSLSSSSDASFSARQARHRTRKPTAVHERRQTINAGFPLCWNQNGSAQVLPLQSDSSDTDGDDVVDDRNNVHTAAYNRLAGTGADQNSTPASEESRPHYDAELGKHSALYHHNDEITAHPPRFHDHGSSATAAPTTNFPQRSLSDRLHQMAEKLLYVDELTGTADNIYGGVVVIGEPRSSSSKMSPVRTTSSLCLTDATKTQINIPHPWRENANGSSHSRHDLFASTDGSRNLAKSHSMLELLVKKKNHAEALDRFYHFARKLDSHIHEAVQDKELSFYSRELGGEFHFIRFQTRHMDRAMELIRSNDLHHDIKEIGVTGGGAHKFSDVFRLQLGIEIRKEEELDSLVAGMQFVLSTVVGECYTFRPENCQEQERQAHTRLVIKNELRQGIDSERHADLKEDTEENQSDRGQGDEWWWSRKVQRDAISYSSSYPYLLVTIGTGVSILRVDGPRKHERISGSTIGGGTYFGLIRLLTDCEDFDDVMKLAERGDPSKVDMSVGDIYGTNSDALEKIGLPSNIVASSFGKLVAMEDPAAGLKEEDLARALLLMVTNNIGQVAFLNAKLHGTKRIYFVGNFLRQNKLSQRRLSYAINYWSKGEMEALFLEHEGYFGALGAFLISQSIPLDSRGRVKLFN